MTGGGAATGGGLATIEARAARSGAAADSSPALSIPATRPMAATTGIAAMKSDIPRRFTAGWGTAEAWVGVRRFASETNPSRPDGLISIRCGGVSGGNVSSISSHS